MKKFTVFSLLLGATLLTVFAELASNDFSGGGGGQANVLRGGEESIFEVSSNVEEEAGATVESETEVTELPAAKSVVKSDLPENSLIDIRDLREAGFFDPFITTISANKNVFGVLEIPAEFQNKIVQAQVMEDSTSVGVIQEFHLEDILQAQSLYTAIRRQAEEVSYFDVNEVNNYGDQSMYLNHTVSKDQVFIIVRVQNYVWAVTYVKSLHPKFKELFINVLPKKVLL